MNPNPDDLIQAVILQRNKALADNAMLLAENAALRRRVEELEPQTSEVDEGDGEDSE